MHPLEDFSNKVEKVIQVLSSDDTLEEKLEDNVIIELSDAVSSCLALTTREQGEELLNCSISLWNHLVEYNHKISQEKEDLKCMVIKTLHVAADAMCVALSSLSGMSGYFDIDWFVMASQFLVIGSMYLEKNLFELSKTCLERCLEVIDANRGYICHTRNQQVVNVTFDAILGLAKVAWLVRDYASLLKNFEAIGQLALNENKVEYAGRIEYNAALSCMNLSEVDMSISILRIALEMLSKHNLYHLLNCLTSKMLRLLAFGYLYKNELHQLDKCIEQAEKLCHSPLSICLKIHYVCQYDAENESHLEDLVNQLVSDPCIDTESLDYVLNLLKGSSSYLPQLLLAYTAVKDSLPESEGIQQLYTSVKIAEIQVLLGNLSQAAQMIEKLMEDTREFLSSDEDANEKIGHVWKQFIETLAFYISITPFEDMKQIAEKIIHILVILGPLWSAKIAKSQQSTLLSSFVLVYSGVVPMSMICALLSDTDEDKQTWMGRTKELTEKLLEWEPESVIGGLTWILITGDFQIEKSFNADSHLHKVAACIVRSCCEYKRNNVVNSVVILVKILTKTLDEMSQNELAPVPEQIQKLVILSFLLVNAFMELNFETFVTHQENTDDWIPLHQIGIHLWKSRHTTALGDMEEIQDSFIWDCFLRIIWRLGQILHKRQRYMDASKFFRCFRIIAVEREEDNNVLAVLQSSLIELTCLLANNDASVLEDASQLLDQIDSQMKICSIRIVERERNKYQCAYLLCKACYLVRTQNPGELAQLVEDATALPYTQFQEMLANIQRYVT
ncbi:hypothetical protein GpartN1_g7755.t1 [Galdieria partita]|uniref:Protein ZIP4 homolog n=1 Tax=Galdieria partita TaxID=83374 RepID=A0A9C7Q5I0_9RHOD|nr:hypothetical protein GpartN1_g7755.t1 [Galdieria partita]